jgi:HSP20 family protein
MADLTVRSNYPTSIFTERDPFKTMRDLLNWSAFPGVPAFGRMSTYAPQFDVKESKDSYVFKADVPGVKESDLEVTYQGNQLIIKGKRDQEEEDQGETYYVSERDFGSFARTFTLPGGVDADHVRAEVREGVLTIALPKKPEAQSRKIAIQAHKAKG